jgi:hypothetical protein
VLTVAYAMAFDGEPASVLKIFFLAGIIACALPVRLRV